MAQGLGTTFDDRKRAGAGLVLGIATIAGALGSQYIGGLYPCELCLTQRWPYYIGLPVLAVLIVVWQRLPRAARALVLAGVAALFVWGAGVGVYHAGVEWGFWPGPQSCTGIGEAAVSLDMLSDMSDARVVPCDAVQWTFLGISLAGFNALISGAIAVLLALSAWGQARRSA